MLTFRLKPKALNLGNGIANDVRWFHHRCWTIASADFEWRLLLHLIFGDAIAVQTHKKLKLLTRASQLTRVERPLLRKPTTFMIACIQRFATFGLVVCATFILFLVWETSLIAAWGLFIAILLSHGIVLALQFVVLPWVNAADASPRATYRQLLFAWFRESVAAAQVFFWWQPFRAQRFPDQLIFQDSVHGKRGVVLVHGFLCNRGVWMYWLSDLTRHHVPFVSVNMEPVFGSIDGYVGVLEKAIVDMHAATGKAPLLVCHSMGGLVARAWYQARVGQDSSIHRIVTIGSPHHGTRRGSGIPKLPWMTNADQMRHGSPWLAELALKETKAQRKRFTCYYSNCDNIVMPAAAAKLEGADNRFVAGVPHVAMLMDRRIMRETLSMLDNPLSS